MFHFKIYHQLNGSIIKFESISIHIQEEKKKRTFSREMAILYAIDNVMTNDYRSVKSDYLQMTKIFSRCGIVWKTMFSCNQEVKEKEEEKNKKKADNQPKEPVSSCCAIKLLYWFSVLIFWHFHHLQHLLNGITSMSSTTIPLIFIFGKKVYDHFKPMHMELTIAIGDNILLFRYSTITEIALQ